MTSVTHTPSQKNMCQLSLPLLWLDSSSAHRDSQTVVWGSLSILGLSHEFLTPSAHTHTYTEQHLSLMGLTVNTESRTLRCFLFLNEAKASWLPPAGCVQFNSDALKWIIGHTELLHKCFPETVSVTLGSSGHAVVCLGVYFCDQFRS